MCIRLTLQGLGVFGQLAIYLIQLSLGCKSLGWSALQLEQERD